MKNQGLEEAVAMVPPRRGVRLSCVLWLLAAILLAACASGPRLQVSGAPAQRSLALQQDGVTLTLAPDAWNAYPTSLSQHYRPILAQIENGRSDEILVRFTDVTAMDQAGNQYRAVPPAEVAQALFGDLGRDPRPASALAEARLYASSWPGWPYRARGYWPYYHSPFFGPYYPWVDPWWDYPYTRPRPTPYDILSLGLREGRVLPGARVEGFLYLQQLWPQAQLLTVLWTPVLPGGQPVTTFRAQFNVVR